MHKMKVLSLILFLVIAVGLFGGCGSSAKLTDGVFKAEIDKYDTHGYKGQFEMTVVSGKITDVKFEEVMEDGKAKSTDTVYNEKMLEAGPMDVEKAYLQLKQDFLAKQSAEVDTVSGATIATKTFKALAKYAIDDMSKKGKTEPGKVPTPK